MFFVYADGNLCHSEVSLFGEPTEFEYLRKVLFEYMMGRETKVPPMFRIHNDNDHVENMGQEQLCRMTQNRWGC